MQCRIAEPVAIAVTTFVLHLASLLYREWVQGQRSSTWRYTFGFFFVIAVILAIAIVARNDCRIVVGLEAASLGHVVIVEV